MHNLEPITRKEMFYEKIINNAGGGGGGSATLIEKSITANGEYAATSDNADGYSKVTADIADFTKVTLWGDVSDDYTNVWRIGIQKNPNGLYTYEYSETSNYNYRTLVALTPLKRCDVNYYNYLIVFTPASDFEGFYNQAIGGGALISYTGDEIVAGDGKTYILKGSYDFQTSTPIVVSHKVNNEFIYTIE